jgi:hypothetical protein
LYPLDHPIVAQRSPSSKRPRQPSEIAMVRRRPSKVRAATLGVKGYELSYARSSWRFGLNPWTGDANREGYGSERDWHARVYKASIPRRNAHMRKNECCTAGESLESLVRQRVPPTWLPGRNSLRCKLHNKVTEQPPLVKAKLPTPRSLGEYPINGSSHPRHSGPLSPEATIPSVSRVLHSN